jgi:hypothetical protein
LNKKQENITSELKIYYICFEINLNSYFITNK